MLVAPPSALPAGANRRRPLVSALRRARVTTRAAFGHSDPGRIASEAKVAPWLEPPSTAAIRRNLRGS